MSEVYLEARRRVDGADVVLLGIPYDGGTSYRAGAKAPPSEARANGGPSSGPACVPVGIPAGSP